MDRSVVPSAGGEEAKARALQVDWRSSDDRLLAELEALEDPLLESQRAKGLTNGELALVIIFLILFFPVGIILLIVFLVT